MTASYSSTLGQTDQQLSARASLLSGLRTGGPRSASPNSQEFAQDHSPPYSPETLGRLKANAAVFTPQSPPTQADQQLHQQAYQQADVAGLQDQLAGLRMQALAAHNNATLANYGVASRQPQFSEEHNVSGRQRQQSQQQQQQQMQLQLAMLQLQAQQQQQQSQQQQQQMYLAQLHAEYERRGGSPEGQNMYSGNSQVQDALSAQEQRQAAQASIQASLRNRQAAQQQQQQQLQQHVQQQIQQQQLFQALQQQQFQNQLMQAQVQAQQVEAMSKHSAPLEQRSWRSASGTHTRVETSPATYSDSPASQSTRSVASEANSWRSRAKTPSIVIDDSSSDTTAESKEGSDGTPETSEEDVTTPRVAKSDGDRYGSLGNKNKGNVSPPMISIHSRLQSGGQLPRAISLASAPRNRAFAETSRTASSAESNLIHPQRQPKGPPSDVKPTNFAARMAVRTRREAVSKLERLCKSPRTVAAFRPAALSAAAN